METTYRLEFNEKQQKFHLGDSTHKPKTFGWVTVIDSCTNAEYLIFIAFAYRIKKRKVTLKYLIQCLKELGNFIAVLQAAKVSIDYDSSYNGIPRPGLS